MGVARARKMGGIYEIFCHTLHFSEDLLLPPPHTYFLIDFKEISSTILAKVKGATAPNPPPPLCVHATEYYVLFYKKQVYKKQVYKKQVYKKQVYKKQVYKKQVYKKQVYKTQVYKQPCARQPKI